MVEQWCLKSQQVPSTSGAILIPDIYSFQCLKQFISKANGQKGQKNCRSCTCLSSEGAASHGMVCWWLLIGQNSQGSLASRVRSLNDPVAQW